MHSTYYQDLGLTTNATPNQIAEAFRSLSLRWNPKLASEDLNTSYRNLCKVAEAYEVLSDQQKKAIYDKYGQVVLKQGFNQNGQHKGGYRFSGNPQQIFQKFFGTKNPYEPLFEKQSNKQAKSIFSALYPNGSVETLKDLVVLVECTLTELYNGCRKSITYKKNILNKDQRTISQITQTKEIQIKPGMSENTNIVHKGLGNQKAGVESSNLIFQIVEKSEKGYKRNGNNLIYTVPISLLDALESKPFTIVTLGGKIINLVFDEILNPKTVREIKSEGMPIYHQQSDTDKHQHIKKGDLIVKFDINFPTSLTEDQKAEINDILEQS